MLGNGYFAITVFTWSQLRTLKAMLGRMMSIMILSNTGLVPISQAISGAVSKWSLTMLFAGAGLLILLVTLWAAPLPGLKTFSQHGGRTAGGINEFGPGWKSIRLKLLDVF